MTIRGACLIGVLLLAGCAAADGPGGKKPDVPWVVTDLAVINAMLDAARVGATDVVYDLGCGDGRIVINAARRGARGVGVDIDEKLIRTARRLAEGAGVADRVTFAVQDLFETDVRPATVVALYLSRELNLRLRPTLLRDLRPGSRVVSHDFDMGDWSPERRFEVARDLSRPHTVFLWTVPPAR